MALSQKLHTLDISTTGNGFVDINVPIQNWLDQINANDGLLTLFIRHTSASLAIQENADPSVLIDLANALDGFAPRRADYHHSSEGPDDMPSHIKSLLTQTDLAIPVIKGRMVLGTWQGVFVIEHRSKPHTRHIALHYLGDFST